MRNKLLDVFLTEIRPTHERRVIAELINVPPEYEADWQLVKYHYCNPHTKHPTQESLSFYEAKEEFSKVSTRLFVNLCYSNQPFRISDLKKP